MANVSKISGLSPVAYLNGAPWNQQARTYCIPSTDNNAYAVGDPMVYAGSADTNGVATVTLATAGTGNTVLGALVGPGGQKYGGPSADPNNLNTIVIPATKTRNYYVSIVDDPNVIYQIEESSTGTAFTAAEVGLNANLASGTNNGYVSGWVISRTGPAVTATLQLRLLGLAQIPNNTFGDYAKWWVIINNHSYRIGQVGI